MCLLYSGTDSNFCTAALSYSLHTAVTLYFIVLNAGLQQGSHFPQYRKEEKSRRVNTVLNLNTNWPSRRSKKTAIFYNWMAHSPASCLGSSELKSWPRDSFILTWFIILTKVFQIWLGRYLHISHNCCFSHPPKFIIYNCPIFLSCTGWFKT